MSIRPEDQQANSNRSGLNIQQPGESYDFDFSSVPLLSEPKKDPSLSLGDYGLMVPTALLDMGRGLAEIPRAISDSIKSSIPRNELEEDARIEEMAKQYNFSEAQKAGMKEVYARRRTGQDATHNALNSVGSVVDSATQYIGSLGDDAGDLSKSLKEHYSDGAKEAERMRLFEEDNNGKLRAGDGFFDKDAWLIKAIPSMIQMVGAGVGAKIGAKATQRVVEQATYKRLIRGNVADDIALITAKEAGERVSQQVQQQAFSTVMTGFTQGLSGAQMRDEIIGLPYEELVKSTTFQNAFNEIDAAETTKGLSDSEKLAKAREITANKAGMAVTTDSKMMAINAIASKFSDAQLFSMVAGKSAVNTIKGGAIKGAAAEGSTEFVQGSAERYVQNQQLIDTAGQNIDPMKDVLANGLEGAAIGTAIGGSAGVVGGIRGKKNGNEADPDTIVTEPTPPERTASSAVEYGDLESPAYLRQDPRIQGFAEDSEVQQALSQESPQPTAEELIQQQIEQGNQGLTSEESAILEQAEQIRNRRTAQQEALDQASTPRLPAPGDTNLGQYHPLPGPVHSFADEQQAGAGNRITITGDKPGKAQPKEGVSQPPKQQEGQLEPPLNTTEQEQAPSTEGVVVSGDQTFVHGSSKADMTLDDIAITGRQTKQGKRNRDYGGFYVLDGNQSEKAEHYSKMQEGTPTLYDVKLHEGVRIYEAKTKGEVERLSAKRIAELVDQGYGAVCGYDIMGKNLETAIIDKNAIADFKPRKPSETTATSALNDEGVVASEAQKIEQDVKPAKQTEVKTESLGELKFFDQKNATPFQTQVGAKASKWGRIEGAKIELHGDGYAVRLPVPKTSVSETSNATDGKGELKLFFGRPFPSEQVAKRTIQVRERGGVVEKIEGGYGVRMPVSGDLTATNPSKNKAAEQNIPTESSNQKVVQGPKIEDFGETLHGAAKHRWGALSSLAETQQTASEIKTQPLSKVFPKPDYKKLAENGVETDKLATLAVLRAQIPTKPKSSHRLDAWADRTKVLRDFAQEVLTGKHDLNAVRSRMKESNKTRAIDDTIELINMFPAEQMDVAANYRVTSGHYTFFNGEDLKRGATRYLLEDSKGRSFMSVNAKSLEELLPKAKEFIQQMHFTEESNTAPTSTKQAKIQIFTNRSTKNVFIGYRGATADVKLKEGFKDTREAHSYLKENRQELEQQLRELREDSRKEQRRESNESRKGPERRKGNVTPEQFSDAFGFRGVQFGNYVEGAKRQQDLNMAYDSLMDLADIMSIPSQAISLNGSLGIAFGARGKGGANAFAAHYEPDSIVINLTKNSGAGSLAHEWFHALDNYFGTADSHGYDSGRPSGEMMTTQARRDYQYVNGKREPTSYTVRPEVYQAFKNVIKSINESGLLQRSQTLDQTRSKAYWSTKVEMSARAFERYILDRAEAKNISNDFLVNLYKQDEGLVSQDRYAYPTSEELDGGVRESFNKFVKELKTKQTDKGTALYSGKSDLGDGNIISESGHSVPSSKPAGVKPRRIELIAQQFVRNLNGAAKIKVKVVATQAEAAAMMPGGIPKEFGTVHAIYQAELNRVILVAENMESDSFVREKLRHEIIAHHGLASVIGDAEYDRVIRVLHQSRNSTNKEIQAVWKKVEKDYGHESPEVQANEFLAHMAERKELTTLGAAWDRFVTMLTNALRKVGMMTERDITPAEIRNILHTITGRFKKTAMYDSEAPGSREFNDTFSRTDALYSATAAATDMDAEIRRKMGFNVEKGAIDKAKDFYGMVSGKDKTQLKEWTRETLRKLNIKTFDGLAQLKYAENEAGISDARVSAYVAARMSAGAGSVTAAMLEFGIAQYNKAEGIIQRKEGTGKADSLMGILDSLGNNREDFFKWIAGHRSERLMKEGKEKNFTAEEIAHMKTLNRGKEAEFSAAKVKYDAFIKSILDLQEDMGLINQESRSQWEDAWYLPYYREAENGETKGPWTSKGIANQRSTVQKLKGSELTIKDPIENLFNYVAKSVDASMKNEAMRKAVVNLADTGIVDVISNPNAMDYQRLGKNVVKVSIDGVESLVQVHDPLLYKAFTMIDMQKSNSMFMRAARQAKRVLTIGTTSMPDFIIRNFMRDALHAWTIGGKSFKPVTDSWRGLNKALKHDDSLIEMMFAGATFGGGYSNVYDPSSTASNIRKALRRKGYKDSQIREFESSIVTTSKQALNKLEAGLNKYQGWSEAGENANRIGTYDAAIKDGKSKAQAAFESRDLMDFSMMGASNIMITLSDMLPFFNARMQGLSKLGRAIKADPMGVAKRGGLITAASLALLALNWDDDRYEELPDWDKDTYWHFFMGEQHYRIPKPFEIGLMFGTLPERMVRAIGGKDSGAKFGKLVAHGFMEQLAFNPIPQVGLPIAESFVNYNFFKGGPIENSADMNLIASARYTDQTSLLAREIGDATGMSPKQIEHIVTGYTGTLGSYVLGAIDTVMRGVGNYGDTPEMRMDEAPVLKSLIRGSGPAKNTQFTEDFYKMLGEANQVHSTINSYMKKGRQEDARKLMDENRSKLAQRKALTNTQKEVKQLNAQIEMVKIDRILTSEQKRERIDRLLSLRNKITQQAVQRVNPYFDK
ncbi:LPD38 domain-containing protein [Budvicia aquatica]|uniref:LPD38 domain-containing protein n=1 Tax=Budvicia aquatica TaxID=82979 RepID=UPI00208D4E3C|nr:LPD38 domain-containing protein [Budvicia aquatica]GKX50630.1 hypothetical protein SOASR029_09390 [Budvicia aquatica]